MDTVSHNGRLSHTVYVLIDPRTDEVRYVGISGNAPLRLKAHLQCDGSNPPKDKWIQELKDNGCELIMKTLEMVDDVGETREREQYWIQHYCSLGAALFNRQVWDSSNDDPESMRQKSTRDTKKYVYLTIGILRDSQTHKDLLADALEHNTKHLPTMAGVRLGDYYKMMREGVTKVVASPSSHSNDEQSTGYTDVALSNAAAASDAWAD